MYSVYVLRHPQTKEIRYVGITGDPGMRFGRHTTNYSDDTHKDRWVQSLRAEGLAPVMEILNDVDTFERACLMEICLIEAFRALGLALVNSTQGGEGCAGFTLTEDQRNKVKASAACRPPHLSEETKAKLSAALSGRKQSEESNARRSESMRLQYASRNPQREAERLAKVSAALRGRKRTPEQCEAIRKARWGK